MKECRNKAPVRPKEKNQELYMKRHVDEREETAVEERTEKRQKGAETMESENTGGSSSSKVG